MAEDRTVLLITEVYYWSPFPPSLSITLSVLLLMTIWSSFISFLYFFSGFAEDLAGQSHTQHSRLVECRCNATIGGSTAGYPSSQGIRCHCDSHFLSSSMSLCPFQCNNIYYTGFQVISNTGISPGTHHRGHSFLGEVASC